MKHFLYLAPLFMLLFLSACAKQIEPIQNPQPKDSPMPSFQSEYGFSFSYPGGWNIRDRDLPDQWALTKGEDTILFTVNEAASDDLLALGIAQAQRDIHPNASEQEMEQLKQVVGLGDFNGMQWYTYAIEFDDKGIDTIVSGIVCANKEVNLVMVSKKQGYEQNRRDYLSMLESFSC